MVKEKVTLTGMAGRVSVVSLDYMLMLMQKIQMEYEVLVRLIMGNFYVLGTHTHNYIIMHYLHFYIIHKM